MSAVDEGKKEKEEAYRRGVEARAEQLLEACVRLGRHRSLWTAHALMATGGDPQELVAVIDQHLGTEQRQDGGPFQIFPSALLLSRWGERVPAAARRRVRARDGQASGRWPSSPTSSSGRTSAAAVGAGRSGRAGSFEPKFGGKCDVGGRRSVPAAAAAAPLRRRLREGRGSGRRRRSRHCSPT